MNTKDKNQVNYFLLSTKMLICIYSKCACNSIKYYENLYFSIRYTLLLILYLYTYIYIIYKYTIQINTLFYILFIFSLK